jgi:hypothetical protein
MFIHDLANPLFTSVLRPSILIKPYLQALSGHTGYANDVAPLALELQSEPWQEAIHVHINRSRLRRAPVIRIVPRLFFRAIACQPCSTRKISNPYNQLMVRRSRRRA